MGVLFRTKCYAIGPMEFDEFGQSWREYLTLRLSPRGIQIIDPYNHPFINGFRGGNEAQDEHRKLREEGRYDELAKVMKLIRSDDLRICDVVDFFVFNLSINSFTCGAFEEFFWANRLKKPIFLVVREGKKRCPLWIFGTIPHKYIYDSLNDALEVIEAVDDGKKQIDSARWRLLKEELR